MTDDQKKSIVLLRKQKIGYASIAKKLNLSKNQVSAFCRREGLAGNNAGAGEKRLVQDSFCRNCGKQISQPAGLKSLKFCCAECRVAWWNSNQDKVSKKAFYDFTCPRCGKSFRAYGNAKRKYCSRECYFASRFGGAHA